MLFWAVVLALVAAVLVIAWRNDRKHSYDLSGRHIDDLGGEIAAKDPNMYNHSEGPPPAGGL